MARFDVRISKVGVGVAGSLVKPVSRLGQVGDTRIAMKQFGGQMKK